MCNYTKPMYVCTYWLFRLKHCISTFSLNSRPIITYNIISTKSIKYIEKNISDKTDILFSLQYVWCIKAESNAIGKNYYKKKSLDDVENDKIGNSGTIAKKEGFRVGQGGI